MIEDCVSAYILTHTIKLGAYFRLRDPDLLIHIRIQFSNYLEFFSYDAKQSESARKYFSEAKS